MKNVLLLGEKGFIGNVIKKKLSKSCNIYYINSDIRVEEKGYIELVNSCIRNNSIDVVINCIAMANVDQCENEKERCNEINYQFVKRLSDLADINHVHFIHVSTNAVYDGENPPYAEYSIRKPCNYYGVCKSNSDEYVESKNRRYTILRPITVYGYNNENERDNPVTYYIKSLIKSNGLKLVDDNIVNMLHVDDFSRCVEKVVQESLLGTFNLSGMISESRYELGVRICRVCNFDLSLIEKVSGDNFKTIAKRARNTTFNNEKMLNTFAFNPMDLDEAILDIYKKLIKNSKIIKSR